jgi:hypothetical protein
MDLVTGVVSPLGHVPAPRPHRPMVEAEARPSSLGLWSRPSSGLWPPPTASRPSIPFDPWSYRTDLLGREALPGGFVGLVGMPLPVRRPPPDPSGLRGPCPRRSSCPARMMAFAAYDPARPPHPPFGGPLPTRQDSRSGTDCQLVPSLVTRVITPLGRPLGRERPGLTTWPAGGDHGRTGPGWSTKPFAWHATGNRDMTPPYSLTSWRLIRSAG